MKTIGYGHACQPSSSCDSINPPITEAEGLALLKSDAARFVSCVDREVTVPVNPYSPSLSLSRLLPFLHLLLPKPRLLRINTSIPLPLNPNILMPSLLIRHFIRSPNSKKTTNPCPMDVINSSHKTNSTPSSVLHSISAVGPFPKSPNSLMTAITRPQRITCCCMSTVERLNCLAWKGGERRRLRCFILTDCVWCVG